MGGLVLLGTSVPGWKMTLMSSTAELEGALRRVLEERTLLEDRYSFLDVAADGASVVVYIRYRDEAAVHAVTLDVTPPLTGPSTGESCSNVAEWAMEVRMLLDEEVGTRDIEAHPRTVTPDGVVHVRL